MLWFEYYCSNMKANKSGFCKLTCLGRVGSDFRSDFQIANKDEKLLSCWEGSISSPQHRDGLLQLSIAVFILVNPVLYQYISKIPTNQF